VQAFVHLGRFLVARSSGRAALERGLPLYLGIGIVATILFSHQGLDAATVVRRTETSIAARLILLGLWTLGTAPVARALIATPCNAFLRSLPASRGQILTAIAALMCVAELPWFILWARGGGAASGIGATAIALALHAALAVGGRRAIDYALGAIAFVAWCSHPLFETSLPTRGIVNASIGVPVFALALDRAWRRAPEVSLSARSTRIAGPPIRALATVYARILVRRHGAAVLRALFLVTVMMTWVTLAAQNDAAWHDAPLYFALTVWIPTSLLAAATPIAPLLRAEKQAQWVWSTTSTTPQQLRAAVVILMFVAGLVIGLVTGVLLGNILIASVAARLRFALALSATGGLAATLSALATRSSLRGDGRDGARVVLALLTIGALMEGVLWIASN
jgi:hypothetical protein